MPGKAILESGIRICATTTRVVIKVARRLADRTDHDRAKIAASLGNHREISSQGHPRNMPMDLSLLDTRSVHDICKSKFGEEYDVIAFSKHTSVVACADVVQCVCEVYWRFLDQTFKKRACRYLDTLDLSLSFDTSQPKPIVWHGSRSTGQRVIAICVNSNSYALLYTRCQANLTKYGRYIHQINRS